MNSHRLRWALLAAAMLIVAASGLSREAQAYSYAAAGAEPLIDSREALLDAIRHGNRSAVQKIYADINPAIDYLDKNEDPGLADAFRKAMASKSGLVVRKVLERAYSDEIERRLKGAGDNIKDYQTAKILVVKAQRFYEAMAGDLAPGRRKAVEEGLKRALDAIGNPGVFGVGARSPDIAAFAKAHADVRAALAGVGR
jgi:hypothetical protein